MTIIIIWTKFCYLYILNIDYLLGLTNVLHYSNSKIINVEITEKMTEELMLSVIKTIFKGSEVLKEIKVTMKNIEHTGNVMDFLCIRLDPKILSAINPNEYRNYNRHEDDDIFYSYNYNRPIPRRHSEDYSD